MNAEEIPTALIAARPTLAGGDTPDDHAKPTTVLRLRTIAGQAPGSALVRASNK